MTISETIDRARRVYARDFKSVPFGVALAQSQLNDLRVDKVGRMNWATEDGTPTYKGLHLYLFREGADAVGPLVFGENAIVFIVATGLASPAQ